jgi:tetratricopeptide (TPR) repeat protein
VTEPFSVGRIEEIQSGPGVEGSTWFRIRLHFGISAFGVNGFRADAGGRVIEEHNEIGTSAGRHEELYVVLSGRARFSVAGEDVDAPAGTLVFVRDPETQRGAVAEEDGTTVLVVGGRPGEAFRGSPWELAADAWSAYEARDYEAAITVFQGVLEEYPRAAGILYNLACCESLSGRHESALEHLRQAIEIEERFREYARQDDDFEAIRGRPDFPV